MPVASSRDSTTTTIANGASLSAAVDLGASRVAAIDIPAAWTAAALTFQGSNDNTTFQNLYDDTGGEVTIASATVAASRGIVPGAALALQLLAHRYLKIRSGTAGSPVNQGADRILTLALVGA